MSSKSKPSFRIPPGYFESVQDGWKIKSLSLKKQSGFKTPENYFTTLNTNLLKTEETKVRASNYLLYSAAASLIICLAVFLEKNTIPLPTNEENIEEIVLLTEEAWENEIYFSFNPEELSFENELVLENSLDYFIEDDRFINLMYEDYE